jgi:hypothetical protein
MIDMILSIVLMNIGNASPWQLLLNAAGIAYENALAIGLPVSALLRLHVVPLLLEFTLQGNIIGARSDLFDYI